ncbi:MAG: dUTP diphosphatase [Sandaracinaceae bacterium]
MPTRADPPPELRLARLRPNAVLPRYATAGAAGLDLSACLEEPLTLSPGDRVRVPTGWAIALPPGHEGQVRPRSGLALRDGITVLNSPGTIDEDYRGELQVLLVHLGDEPVTLRSGDRIAQLVVAPVRTVRPTVLDEGEALPPSGRGEGGFGSTGR